MKFKKEYKVRNIAGENIIIKQGRFGADMTRVIALNESSLLLWEQLQGKDFETEDVVNILLDNYDIDSTTATNDAKVWIEKLVECELVE
jgi:hypothetical protein